MRFERIGRNAVKIIISACEARGAGLSQKRQLFTGREGAFMGLIEKIVSSPALDSLNANFSGKISGEIIPSRDGGLVVYICTENAPPPSLARYLITVGDIDSLICVCTELSMAGLSSPDCALFADKSTARLTARLPREKCPLTDRLRQYASLLPVDEHILTAVSEHFSQIIERNAVTEILENF